MLILCFLVSIFPIAYGFSNGVNLQPSYYNNGQVTFGWDEMAKYPQIKTLRIEIEPDKVNQAKDWIAQAHSHGYEVIATYHHSCCLGSDDVNEILGAANWWVQNYRTLASSGNFSINLINEWGSHNQNANSYASAYNQAIAIVRKVYPSNMYIVCDIPGWGQETRVAGQAARMISDPRIILSAHVYPGAYNQGAGHWLQASDLDDLRNSGKGYMIGEFGTVGSGGCNVPSVINYAKSAGFWGIVAWAWNGDGGQMNMVTPPWTQNPQSAHYYQSGYFNDVFQFL